MSGAVAPAARIVLSACLLAGASCRAAADPTPAATVGAAPSAEYGRLDTEVREVRRPTCWTLSVRGRVRNPYDEPVEGVRLIIHLRQAGEAACEVQRLETELDATVAPGTWVPFTRELTMGCTSALFNDAAVVSFAVRRGGRDLPVPEPARERELGGTTAVAAPPVSVPIVTSPVAIP